MKPTDQDALDLLSTLPEARHAMEATLRATIKEQHGLIRDLSKSFGNFARAVGREAQAKRGPDDPEFDEHLRVLHDDRGMSYQEIADAECLSFDAARGAVRRARERLK
jgi:hypothetical protein